MNYPTGPQRRAILARRGIVSQRGIMASRGIVMGRGARRSLFILAALLATPSCARSADWPQWLGPARNGLSSESQWSWEWPETGPRQLWTASVGPGFSAVSVSQGRAYTMGYVGKGADKETVVCLDAATGKTIWQFAYDARNAIVPFAGPRSTPTVDEKVVYTLGQQGRLHCLDIANGAVLWSVDFKSQFGGKQGPKGEVIPKGYGYACSPLVADDLVIVDVGAPKASIVAFNKHTGEVVWKSLAGLGRHPNGAYSSPILAQWNGRETVALFACSGIVVLDSRSGATLWTYGWEIEASAGHHIATLVADGDRLFASDLGARGCELVEIGKTNPVWKSRQLKNHWSNSVLWNGFFYGFDGRDADEQSALVSLDAGSGTEKWRQATEMSGSVICAAGKLICLTLKGRLFVVDATPAGYKELASAQIFHVDPARVKQFAAGHIEHGNIISPDVCRTPPVLSGARIYCRNAKGDVLCLDVSK